MTGPVFLAVDGGNSKTDVVLGTATGVVLAFVRGPGSSPHEHGVPAAIDLLDVLVAATRSAAGRPGDAVVDRAEIYLAGADLPVEVDVLMREVGQAGWAKEYRVDNDTFALLRAGTDNPDAVAVVCGAGINCVGRAADGNTARFQSLGQVSGDWGGGHHLAAMALWHAARGEDGRGPGTALTVAVARHCGQSTIEDVSAGVHLGDIPRERVDELAAVLFAVAASGDPVARRVVARQAEEIVSLATVAAGRLGLLDRAYAVVLGGGVLRARHPLLEDTVRAGIAARSPHAEISVVAHPPVIGAALLALDALGAPPSAAGALRAALTAATPRPVRE
ncbi:MAG TPA: BadF/BadG/BcrA/BcrD ATPase family protein [Micromonosporaceae bacterium]|jgi:N-acetylglucosamine kinase-like BadF-type ATPase|nr:BadF/BadG/BcrA/BcrD ATPase family protein [Micromonosporaceae bacterium]